MNNATNRANNLRALGAVFTTVALSGDIHSLLVAADVYVLLNGGHLTQCDIQHAETALLSACQSGGPLAVTAALSSLSYTWDREGLTGSRVMDAVAYWADNRAA